MLHRQVNINRCCQNPLHELPMSSQASHHEFVTVSPYPLKESDIKGHPQSLTSNPTSSVALDSSLSPSLGSRSRSFLKRTRIEGRATRYPVVIRVGDSIWATLRRADESYLVSAKDRSTPVT